MHRDKYRNIALHIYMHHMLVQQSNEIFNVGAAKNAADADAAATTAARSSCLM